MEIFKEIKLASFFFLFKCCAYTSAHRLYTCTLEHHVSKALSRELWWITHLANAKAIIHDNSDIWSPIFVEFSRGPIFSHKPIIFSLMWKISPLVNPFSFSPTLGSLKKGNFTSTGEFTIRGFEWGSKVIFSTVIKFINDLVQYSWSSPCWQSLNAFTFFR